MQNNPAGNFDQNTGIYLASLATATYLIKGNVAFNNSSPTVTTTATVTIYRNNVATTTTNTSPPIAPEDNSSVYVALTDTQLGGTTWNLNATADDAGGQLTVLGLTSFSLTQN